MSSKSQLHGRGGFVKSFGWLTRFSNLPDIVVFGAAGLWCVILFGIYAWPAWSHGFDANALIAVERYSDFSDKSSWLPLAMEVAKGRLFPITSTSGDALNGLSYYPYISLWIFGSLVALLGPGLAFAASQIVFPTITFVFSALTFRLYLPRRWALMLAALGVMAYSNYPFRDFLEGLLFASGLQPLGTLFRPDLANVPFPAISATAFVATFYFTMRCQRLSGTWIIGLTLAWALQTQVHVINGLFGIPFWLTYLPMRLWQQRRNDGNDAGNVVRIWLGQALLMAIVVMPALAGFAGWFNPGVGAGELFAGARGESTILSPFYFVVYFVLPVSATALVATVRRIDPYEIWTRFWPIILFMLVELFLAFAYLSGIGLLPELVSSRIGVFFLHMLYFVPLVHYSVRPTSTVAFSFGIESHPVAARVRAVVRWLLNDASLVYLPVIFVLLTQFAVISGKQALEFENQRREPAAREVRERLELLSSNRGQDVRVVADENLATNLNLRLVGDYASLINNRFANQIDAEDAFERMTLYARAVGWDETTFIRFMLPALAHGPLHWRDVLFLDESEGLDGLGYWLVFHQRVLSKSQRRVLEEHLRDLFANMDLAGVAKRVGLGRVLSSREPASVLRPIALATTAYGTLYKLDLNKVE